MVCWPCCNTRRNGRARRSRAVPASAVDELMRYDSSVQMTFRYALTDLEWRGKRMRTGDLVAIVFGAANRDEHILLRLIHLT